MPNFMGYPRPDGSVGIRNHIVVLPIINCVNSVSEAIGRVFPEVIAITHANGCTFDPVNNQECIDVFVGIGTNPNVGAVLLVSLGCETVPANQVYDGIKATGKPVELITVQKCGGTVKAIQQGIEHVHDFRKHLSSMERIVTPISELIIGTECGASDSYSGISANPAVGYVSDKFVDFGATVILSEPSECIGAEEILSAQSASAEIAREVVRVISETEGYLAQQCIDTDLIAALKLGERPDDYLVKLGADIAPGNIEGGLSTIEEKTLGCIRKGGTRPIQEVVAYAKKPTKKGLIFMDGPGHDIESMVSFAAGGAQLIFFTTGRGTPAGCPVTPVIKVASNSELFEFLGDNMDVNAGEILNGSKSLSQVGEEMFRYALQVINGQETKSEQLRCREFAIRRKGVNKCIF